MKIATWNVNSIRARLPVVSEWVSAVQPDVLVLQETKVEDEKFPWADLEPLGYQIKIHGQQRYNGVAILSKNPVTDVETGFCDPNMPEDCRIISAVVDGIKIINTYVPNGTAVGGDKWAYKMAWLDRFADWCGERNSLDDPVVWLGDINIAPTPGDVFEPERHLGDVGHHPDEFERLKRIVGWGWTDCFRKFESGPEHYTFFDFRIRGSFSRNLGWRIDHIYTTPVLVDRVTECWHDGTPRRMERPSDHIPVLAHITS